MPEAASSLQLCYGSSITVQHVMKTHRWRKQMICGTAVYSGGSAKVCPWKFVSPWFPIGNFRAQIWLTYVSPSFPSIWEQCVTLREGVRNFGSNWKFPRYWSSTEGTVTHAVSMLEDNTAVGLLSVSNGLISIPRTNESASIAKRKNAGQPSWQLVGWLSWHAKC